MRLVPMTTSFEAPTTGVTIQNQPMNMALIFSYKKMNNIQPVGVDETFFAIQFRDPNQNYHFWYYPNATLRDAEYLQLEMNDNPNIQGLKIDLSTPSEGEFSEDEFFQFPAELESFGIYGVNEDTVIKVDESQIGSLEELVSIINQQQDFYVFVALSATTIGVQEGTLPISSLEALEITEQGGDLLEYNSPFPLLNDSPSTLENVLEELRQIKNLVNGKRSTQSSQRSIQASNTRTIIARNELRKKIVITNISPYPMYIGEGTFPQVTIDKYNFRVLPGEYWISTDTINAIQVIWDIPTEVTPLTTELAQVLETN